MNIIKSSTPKDRRDRPQEGIASVFVILLALIIGSVAVAAAQSAGWLKGTRPVVVTKTTPEITVLTSETLAKSNFDAPVLITVARTDGSYSFARIENAIITEDKFVGPAEFAYQNGDYGTVAEGDNIKIFVSKRGSHEQAAVVERGIMGLRLSDGTVLPVKVTSGQIVRGRLTGDFQLLNLNAKQQITGTLNTRSEVTKVTIAPTLKEVDPLAMTISKQLLKLSLDLQGESGGKVLGASTDKPGQVLAVFTNQSNVAPGYTVTTDSADGSVTVQPTGGGSLGLGGVVGPIGPAGPAGPVGATGATGATGAAGTGSGDITGVGVGDGLQGGGSSGDVSLSVNLNGGTTSTATNSTSGMEVSSSGLSLIRGCTNGQVLAWNSSTAKWECSSSSGGGGTITGVTAGNGLTGGGTSGNVTLSALLTSSGTSGNTSSNSGLEVSSSGLALLRGCSNNQVLNWNSGTSSWQCSNVTASSAAFSSLTSGTNTIAAMVVGTGASLNFSGTGTINASTLNGNTFANPGAIGGGTAAAGTFTTLTANSLLTASNGLTLTTGALNLTATSGTLNLSGLSASSISTGANNITFTSGNFNTTATGINSTAIGATTASTGRFTSVTDTGLAINSAVYTDGSSGLTTTAPTSGTIGYWSRSGTTLSPATSGDAVSVTGTTTLSGNFATPKGSDYPTTGVQNDVNFGTGSLFRYTGVGTATFTGISGGTDGRRITIMNASSSNFTLSNEGTGSTATNRIVTAGGTDDVVKPNVVVTVQYDSTTARWRILSQPVTDLTTTAFVQNGNGFGTAAVLGTTDAFGLNFITAGSTRFAIDSASSTLTGTGPTIFTSTGTTALTSAAGSTLNVTSGTTGALTLDSGTTGAVNLGNGANAKTITIGNTTGATGVTINSGTNGISVGDTANTKTINIGGVTNSGTDTINIATNGTAADAIAIGNANAATTLALTGGTSWSMTSSGVLTLVGNHTPDITTTAGNSLTVDSGTTGALNFGTGANAKTISIGNTTGATAVNISAGSGGGTFVSSNGLTLNPYGTATGNTTEIRFAELAANGTNYVGFKSPDSLAGNVIWTLPIADGTNNQVLSTDGSGHLMWNSSGACATCFTNGGNSFAADAVLGTNDANLLNFRTNSLTRMTILSGGNVGVGDTTPASLFTVGNGDKFQVDTNGNILSINNVATSFPSTQGASGSVLTNDGAGNLTWNPLSSSSTTALNGITAATGSATINNGNNNINWNWSLTGVTNGFQISEGTASVGTGYIMRVGTIASSTAKPFSIAARGTTIIDTTATGGLVLGDSATLNTPITLQSGTGAINIGTDAVAKTITIGNSTAGTALSLAANGASSLNIGSNVLTITSSNFNTTAAGINSTAIGATTASTGKFTSVTDTGLAINSAVYTDGTSGLTTTAPTSGAIGYWTRTGTTLSPTTAGDAVTTSGNISTTSTGTMTSAGLLTASGGLTISGNYITNSTDYVTTGTQNNVNFGATPYVDYLGAGTATITGITGGSEGRQLIISNESSSNLTISNLGSGSLAANRVRTPDGQDILLEPNETAVLIYDAESTQWHVLTSPVTSASIKSFAFVQSGNAFGTAAILGTTDAFGLNIITAGNTRFAVDSASSTLTGTGSTILTSTGAISLTSVAGSAVNVTPGTTGALNLATTNTGNVAIGNSTGTFALTSSGGLNVTTGGALTGVASLDTITTSATGLGFAGTGSVTSGAATALNIIPGTTGALNLATTNTGNVAIGNSTGTFALTSSGGLNVTTGGALTGVASLDTITTSATALGFAGTGSVTTGAATALNITPGTTGALNLATTNTGNVAIGNATGTFALTSSGGLNVTTGGALTGVASLDTITTSATALGFAGTGSLTTGAATALNITPGTTGALNLATTNTGNVAIGNSTGTFALTSSGGLNVTTGGALTGVASVDTIGVTATGLTFAGAGTIATTNSTLTLSSGTGDINVGVSTQQNISIGNTVGTTTVNIAAGGQGSINIGTNAVPNAINIGTGAAGKAVTLGSTNSTSSATIQSGTGGINFIAGPTSSSTNVRIGNSATATPDLLVLDNGTADPTGINGGMYYNTTSNKFKCFENSAWRNCTGSQPQETLSSFAAVTTTPVNTDVLLGTISITPTTAVGDVFISAVLYANSANNTNQTITSSIHSGATCAGTQLASVTSTLTSGAGSDGPGGYMSALVTNPGASAQTYAICAQSTLNNGAAVGGQAEVWVIDTGADYAELYNSNDTTLQPGDVVSVDGTITEGVKKSNIAYDSAVFGIVSTRPGMIIGSPTTSALKTVPIALNGRVPVKVSSENGVINVGDALTASSVPGVAMKATKAGAIIGMAMTGFDGQGLGTVLAYVKSGSTTGSKIASSDGRAILNELLTQQSEVAPTNVSDIFSDRLAAGVEVITPKVTAKEVDLNGVLSMFGADGKENVRIDSLGNAMFAGTITADTIEAKKILGYSILTNSIEALSSKVDTLATASAQATPSASPAINVADLVSNLFKKAAEFFDNVIFHGDVFFAGRPTFNKDTAGFAYVKTGQSEVEVNFDKEYAAEPVVTASINLVGNINVNDIPGYAIYDLSTRSFKIKLSRAAGSDLGFSWIALAVKDAKSVEGANIAVPSLIITPTPTASATPSIIITPTLEATISATPTLSPTPTASESGVVNH